MPGIDAYARRNFDDNSWASPPPNASFLNSKTTALNIFPENWKNNVGIVVGSIVLYIKVVMIRCLTL
ncbi:MAG: hypothetical protein A2511_11615 [Deltaproteobacteria bacterium RIFOXYD12_FULL_50_9]|nr:MAG: hypothetical protein A2511_11615 [Deltaproteobacteria bacterium RIFOXYD12_FULL_50_9]